MDIQRKLGVFRWSVMSPEMADMIFFAGTFLFIFPVLKLHVASGRYVLSDADYFFTGDKCQPTATHEPISAF